MRQVLFTIPIFGGLKVFGYGAMLVLAFLGSTWLAAWRARARSWTPRSILDMAFWVFLGGLVGARLFYCIQYWGTRHRQPARTSSSTGRGDRLLRRHHGRRRSRFFVYRHSGRFRCVRTSTSWRPSIAVGTLFGRLGCFLNGCCYGDVCNLPWAVSFPKHSPPWEYRGPPRLDPADAALLAAAPPDADLLGDRRPDPADPALGLLSAPPPRRRGDGRC